MASAGHRKTSPISRVLRAFTIILPMSVFGWSADLICRQHTSSQRTEATRSERLPVRLGLRIKVTEEYRMEIDLPEVMAEVRAPLSDMRKPWSRTTWRRLMNFFGTIRVPFAMASRKICMATPRSGHSARRDRRSRLAASCRGQ
jgi:hypothetical protein